MRLLGKVLCLCALAVLPAKAALYPVQNGGVIDEKIAVINSTSSIASTNGVNSALYHTVQLFTTTVGTNTCSLALAGTIDGTNFTTIGTLNGNTNASVGTNFIGQYKSLSFTLTITATNASALVNYMGGR